MFMFPTSIALSIGLLSTIARIGTTSITPNSHHEHEEGETFWNSPYFGFAVDHDYSPPIHHQILYDHIGGSPPNHVIIHQHQHQQDQINKDKDFEQVSERWKKKKKQIQSYSKDQFEQYRERRKEINRKAYHKRKKNGFVNIHNIKMKQYRANIRQNTATPQEIAIVQAENKRFRERKLLRKQMQAKAIMLNAKFDFDLNLPAPEESEPLLIPSATIPIISSNHQRSSYKKKPYNKETERRQHYWARLKIENPEKFEEMRNRINEREKTKMKNMTEENKNTYYARKYRMKKAREKNYSPEKKLELALKHKKACKTYHQKKRLEKNQARMAKLKKEAQCDEKAA